MSDIKGIDVSVYQGKIDWNKVKEAGYTAVAMKATEGTTWTDPDFVDNFNGAKAAGMHICIYHYGHPQNYAISDAIHFLDTVRKVGFGDGPLILDIETNDAKGDVSQWAHDFLTYVQQQSGHAVAWYSYPNFIQNSLQSVKLPFPEWIASYQATAPTFKWAAWQMSDNGKVPGINGYVDVDMFDSSLFVGATPKPVITPPEPKPPVPVPPKKPKLDKTHLAATLVTVLGGLKLLLQMDGIKVPNVNINSLSNTIAAVAVVAVPLITNWIHQQKMKK